MTALLRAELLKLRTTRTFAAVVACAAALSLTLVVLGAALVWRPFNKLAVKVGGGHAYSYCCSDHFVR
jgi:hypothetical protein